MKYYYLLLFTITTLQTACYSQENRIFVDPTEKYEIEIPKEWTVKKLSGSNLLVRASGKSPVKFFTLVIAKSEISDLEQSYTDFVYKMSGSEGFKIIRQGEKIINDRKYKWFIESHKSRRNGLEETSYILFTNKEGKTLQVIMVADPQNLEIAKTQFDQIAETLKY